MSAAAEIGSEFPLRPRPVPQGTSWAAGAASAILSTLPGVGADPICLRSGRDALAHVTGTLADCGAEVLLLPAFACDSLVIGCRMDRVEWLPVGPDLMPRPEAVVAAAHHHGARAALLVMPLFGRGLSPALADAVEEAEERGVTLIDDRSHCSLSPAVPSTGRIGIASLRKWLALPDGGLAWGVDAPEHAAGDDDLGFVAPRRAGMEAKWRWLRSGEGDKQSYLDALGAAERALDRCSAPTAMSVDAQDVLAHTDLDAIGDARRANHATLMAAVAEVVTPLVPGDLPDGVVPLGLPVLFDDQASRDRVRRALIKRRIYCALHWPLPAAVDPAAHPTAANGAARILTLPCDQRYGLADMARLATALNEVVG